MPSNPGQLIEFTGELISQTIGTLVIETCPPTADCPSIPYTISLKAQGLSLPTMPKGVYMKVSAQFQQGWACVSQLLIQNAPSWAGVPNPNSQDEFVWFAGADGTTDVLPGSPFVIEPQALGCYPDAPPDCGPKDDYQLLFTSLAIPGYTKAVSMGNTIEWALKDPNGRFLLIRNLRSYSSGFCDDYWNWAYWMSFPPTVD